MKTKPTAKSAPNALSLEVLLTSREGFALDASPLQRALVRAASGWPVGDVLDDDEIERYFGCSRATLDAAGRPSLVVVVAGVRGGKSLIAGGAAFGACLSADLSGLPHHEVARFPIVAPTVDNASATYRLLLGHVLSSASMRKLLAEEPTADTIAIRRPDGRIVEIVVVAASRGAVTLRSRWLLGFVFDESALFGAESTGAVVSAEELLRVGETRLVPRAQGWLISSPFGPSGLMHDLWRGHFGKPGHVLVVHAPTRALNPTFPAEQIEAVRSRAPDVAAREFDAQWVDPDFAFLDGPLIDQATRKAPPEEPPLSGARYVAAWDAATRGNAWTLVVARGSWDLRLERVTISLARQWNGSKVRPLDPSVVIAEIAAILKRYNVSTVLTDAWGVDALQSIARGHGLTLQVRSTTPNETYERFDRVRTLLQTGRIELAPVPALLSDLKSVRKRALSNGVRIELPRTSDGRHCDFAPSVALACELAPSVAGVPLSALRPVRTRFQIHGGFQDWSGKAEPAPRAPMVIARIARGSWGT